MMAHESNLETIIQGSEIRRDDAKDVQWETIDRDHQVPPLMDDSRSGREILSKLRKLEKPVFRAPEKPWTSNHESQTCSKVKLGQSAARHLSVGGPTYDAEYAILFNSVLRATTSCGSERPFPG